MPGHICRRRWPQWIGSLFFICLVIVSWWWEQQAFDRRFDPPNSEAFQAGVYTVLRVVDGDTLLLEQDRTRVRLQGIDTPETVKENTPIEAWGEAASHYTKTFVARANHRVRLEFDGESRDQYGRVLAFVWHEARLLNEELVRQGLARARLGYQYSSTLKDRLQQAQKDAQTNRRGIWKTETSSKQ